MEEEFAKIRDIVENYPYVAMVSLIYFHGKICAQPHKFYCQVLIHLSSLII